MMLKRLWILSLIFVTGVSIAQAQQQLIEPIQEYDVPATTLHLDEPLLIVGGSKEVTLFDISNRAAPQQISKINTDSGVMNLTSTGDLLIVGLETRKEEVPNFLVYDITDPASPESLYERRAGEEGKIIQMVHAVGQIVYVGFDPSDMLSIRVAKDQEPLIVGTYNTQDVVTDMIDVGSRAYLATWLDIQVLDISDPENVQMISKQDTDDINNGLDIDGNILVSAEGFWGASFYDISDPDQLTLLQNYELFQAHEVFQIAARQKFCYLAITEKRSTSVFDPTVPGGLRILDFERMDQIEPKLKHEADHHGFDVIAYDGYVYFAEDNKMTVFEHGPKGEIRPTSTPTIPTSTPTPTFTFTPTNTPPLIATATKKPQPTPEDTPPPEVTPTPVATPTFPPQPTSTPSPTWTPTQPAEQTPTPPSSELEVQFFAGFDGPTLGNDRFAKQLPFEGDFTEADLQITSIPTDNAFENATNGRGLKVTAQPGEALTFLGPFLEVEDAPVLLRVSVRSNGGGCSVALAAMDGSFDGSVATNIPADSDIFNGEYKRMTMIYKAPSNSVIPLLQVAYMQPEGAPVEIYFDNFELIPLPPGQTISTDMLGEG